MEASNSSQRFSATMAKHEEFMQRVQARHEEFMQWMKDEHRQLMQSINDVEFPHNIICNDGDSQVQDPDSRDDVENQSSEAAKSDWEDKDRTIEVGRDQTNSSDFFDISPSRTSVSPIQSIPFGQAGSLSGSQPFGSDSQTVFGATSTSTFDSAKTSAFCENVAHTYVPFVQTGAVLGSQPFGTGSQPSFDARNTFTFGSLTVFASSPAASGIVAPTYGAPSNQSVPLGQTRSVLGSQPFGTGSQLAFDASNISTFASTPEFGSSSVVGEIVAPTHGATTNQSVPLGQTTPVLGSRPFGTGSQSVFDATNVSTFDSVPMFGSSSVLCTGMAIVSTNGAPSGQLDSSGHTIPVLGSQRFGTVNQSSFGGTSTSAFSSTPASVSRTTLGEIVAPTYGSPSTQSLPCDKHSRSAFSATSTSTSDSTTSSAFGENVSHMYGASNTQSVPFRSTGHFLGSQPFGAGSQFRFGGLMIPTFGSTPTFDSLSLFGRIAAPEYSAPSSKSVTLGQARPVVGNHRFDTGNQPAFGGTSTSAFGSKPALSENGPPGTQSVPFGQAGPVFARQPFDTGSQSAFSSMTTSGFGSSLKLTFGSHSVPICSGKTDLARHGGTRVTSYRRTPESEDGLIRGKIISMSGMPEYKKIMSLSGMPECKSKSHGELRLEDYQLDDKGGQNFSSQHNGNLFSSSMHGL